jgi:hypothetical protein
MSDINNQILEELKKQSILLEKISLNMEILCEHKNKSEEINQINSIFGQLMQSFKPKNECVEDEDEIEECD